MTTGLLTSTAAAVTHDGALQLIPNSNAVGP